MATISSNGTGGGLASATTTWAGGVVPTVGDSVTIAAGDTVTLDGVYTWGDDTTTGLVVNGALSFSRTVNSELICHAHLVINTGGELDIGNASSPIPIGVTATLTINDTAQGGNPTFGLEAKAGSTITMVGSVNHTIQAKTTAGTYDYHTFTVDDATGWTAGDKIFIQGDLPYGQPISYHYRTIQSVSGNTITLTETNTTDYVDAGAVVYNKKRNVIIQSSTFNSDVYLEYYGNANDTAIRHFENVFVASTIDNGHQATGDYWQKGFHIYKCSTPEGVSATTFTNVVWEGVLSYKYSKLLTFTGCYIEYHKGVALRLTEFNHCVIINGRAGWGGLPSNRFINCFNNGTSKMFPWLENSTTSDALITDSNLHFGWDGFTVVPPSSYRVERCTLRGIQKRFLAGTESVTVTFIDCDSSVASYNSRYSNEAPSDPITDLTFDRVCIKNKGLYQTFPYNSGQKTYFLNARKDPKRQYYSESGGVISRDITTFNSTVASIKFEPMHSLVPLVYKTTKTVVASQTITVEVACKTDTSYVSTVKPTLRIKCAEFDVTATATTTGTFETLNVTSPTLTQTLPVEITLEADATGAPAITYPYWNTSGYSVDGGACWFDDLKIDGVIFDIGQDLFAGGTEVSNVVDITDTLKHFTFTINKAITGYEWRIYQVNAIGSLAGAVELAGNESESLQTITYDYNYSTDIPIAVQILGHANKIVESVTYYTLSNQNQNVNIALEDDLNG